MNADRTNDAGEILDRTTAAARARETLAQAGTAGTIQPVLIETDVIERPTIFLFGWTTQRYTETHDWRDAIAGSTHLLVDRRDGRVEAVDLHGSLDAAIERYEARRRARSSASSTPVAGSASVEHGGS